eukprot:GHRQ01010025.1.p1 GENE.GHRQ01010025.1~~GHRQ01010025.1.p1  ORF type:complete len:113 (+),score=9.64 GHRQ01010025.1:690-1028(+)
MCIFSNGKHVRLLNKPYCHWHIQLLQSTAQVHLVALLQWCGVTVWHGGLRGFVQGAGEMHRWQLLAAHCLQQGAAGLAPAVVSAELSGHSLVRTLHSGWRRAKLVCFTALQC